MTRWSTIACGTCAFAAISTMSSAPAGADVAYVDDDAPAGGDGSSWETAYDSLHDALADPTAGEIRIGQGSYPAHGSDPGVHYKVERDAQVWRGAYAGYGAPDPDVRDVAKYDTVLEGDITGDDESGMIENNSRLLVQVVNSDDVELDGLVFARAWGWEVGALSLVQSTVTIRDCTFLSNRGNDTNGGAAHVNPSSEATFTDCRFVTNTANEGPGGGLVIEGEAAVEGCTFDGNVASSGGGAINVADGALATMFGCTFVGNVADGSGGAVGNDGFTEIAESSFLGNEAGGWGGAIESTSTSGILWLTACTLDGNLAVDNGGALAVAASIVTACTLTNNSAADAGGAIYHTGSSGFALKLEDCLVEGNSAATNGGGIGGIGPLILIRDDIRLNATDGDGGGISIRRVVIDGGTIADNEAGGDGGGLWCDLSARLTGAHVVGNVAQNGGGIWAIGADFTACTIRDNEAAMFGGGAYLEESVVHASVFEENLTGTSGGGLTVAGGFSIEGSILRSNVATTKRGAGVFAASGAVDIANSMVQENVSPLPGGGVTFASAGGSMTGVAFCGNAPTDAEGPFDDLGGNQFLADCVDGDANGDGVVDITDLLEVLSTWGPCVGACPADLDHDEQVAVSDLLLVLAGWS